MSIIITGATGELGSLVVKELQEKNLDSKIIAVARDIEKAKKQFADTEIEVRFGDYDEPYSLEGAFGGASKLLFISSPEIDDMKRVIQHANIVKAARDAGVEHILYTSYAFAEESKLPLALLHLNTEYAIRVSNIPYTFIRNSLYSEVFINAGINPSIEKGELVTNTGTGGLNTVNREDLAKGTAEVLANEGHENKTYNFVSSKTWNFDELAETISNVTGNQVSHKAVSLEKQMEHFRETGFPEGAALFTASVYQAIAEGETAKTSNDLKQLIGEETSLETIVKKALEK